MPTSTVSSVIYIIEGALMILSNALLALTILCNGTLRRRKELVFITALSISDSFYGLGSLLTGSFRLYFSIFNADGNNTAQLVTPWSCFFILRQILLFYGGEVSILMMTAISMERFVAVSYYQFYSPVHTRTMVVWASTVFLVPIFPVTAAMYQIYIASVQGELVLPVCFEGLPNWYGLYHNWFSGIMGIVSVLLYVAVIVRFQKLRAKVAITSMPSVITNKVQSRFTITLGIAALFTLVLHTIPFGVVTVMLYLHSSLVVLATYVWMLVRINSLIHVMVIYWRQTDIRHSLLSYFKKSVV
jgi:hypothetical protein